MGIQHVQIRGFRSLKDVRWSPGKLNVLIGPNGSGKSNLLRALALLRQSARGELPQAILRLGGIGPLLWDQQSTEAGWKIRLDPPQPTRDRKRDAMTYELLLRQLGRSSTYRVGQETLGHYFDFERGDRDEPVKVLDRDDHRAVMFDEQARTLQAIEGSVPDDQTLLSMAAGPFGNPVVRTFRERVAGWGIYHDVDVGPDAQLRQAAVARVETQVAPDGQNLVPVLHTLYSGKREFKRTLDSAMRTAFGGEFEELVFPPAADQRVQMRLRWSSLTSEQSAADISDGTIRFLLLIALLANPEPGDVVAIDEPEAGLHPRMLPIVAELAATATERTQVILTTHSPQLLDALAEARPTTTVCTWVNGQTNLSVIAGEELERWLEHYSLGELHRSAQLEALA